MPFTRPKGFGKNLNMDTLRTLFESSKEDTARYLADRKIWECGQKYTGQQGHHPVIHPSFRGLSAPIRDAMPRKRGDALRAEFMRQRSLVDLPKAGQSYVLRGRDDDEDNDGMIRNGKGTSCGNTFSGIQKAAEPAWLRHFLLRPRHAVPTAHREDAVRGFPQTKKEGGRP